MSGASLLLLRAGSPSLDPFSTRSTGHAEGTSQGGIGALLATSVAGPEPTAQP